MPLVQAMPLDALPSGTVAEFETTDAAYALCNIDGTIHCVDGVCPHADGPLAQGTLHGTTLVCPWHGWEFDVRSGACEVGDGCRLNTYPVSIKDGSIYIQLL